MKKKNIATAFAGAAIVLSFSSSAFAADSMTLTNNLTIGSRGTEVTSLQTFLVAKGFLTMPAGVSMGYFGSLTKSAVMQYQTSAGIMSTGFFGPLTRAKFNSGKDMMASGSGSASGGVMVGGAMMIASRDIVDNALLANNVTTLVAAVKAAGLVDTLKGAGPFTVFAPTNSAFAKLQAGTVDSLLKPENKSQLAGILTYHVVAGRYTSADLTDGLVLKTVEGKTLKFKKDAAGTLWINGVAMIETADVISRNGVTHVIDSVLMPSQATYSDAGVEVGGALMVASKDIVDNALSASNVTTLVAAVKAAGLVDTLKGAGPFTVFAPNNDAFAKLPTGTVDTLVKPENKAKLVDILTYHVVAGRYTSSDLYEGQSLTTVQGKKLMIGKTNGKITINGAAMVVTPNVISRNGVTFVIDTVLMPAN